MAAAGYPAPSIVGALLLALLLRDETRIAGAVVVIVLALLLPLQRSLLSFGISLAMIAGMLLVLLAVPTEASTLALAFVSGVLCVSSPRTIVELHRYRTRVRREQFTTGDAAQHSDADTLAELTHIPALIWEGVFLILSLAAVALAISNSR